MQRVAVEQRHGAVEDVVRAAKAAAGATVRASPPLAQPHGLGRPGRARGEQERPQRLGEAARRDGVLGGGATDAPPSRLVDQPHRRRRGRARQQRAWAASVSTTAQSVWRTSRASLAPAGGVDAHDHRPDRAAAPSRNTNSGVLSSSTPTWRPASPSSENRAARPQPRRPPRPRSQASPPSAVRRPPPAPSPRAASRAPTVSVIEGQETAADGHQHVLDRARLAGEPQRTRCRGPARSGPAGWWRRPWRCRSRGAAAGGPAG